MRKDLVERIELSRAKARRHAFALWPFDLVSKLRIELLLPELFGGRWQWEQNCDLS
jgi:hypothetical protein